MAEALMSDTETNPTEATVWGAAMPVPTTARDGQGRFLTGNSGGGRRKGSRNKLIERFLDTIADDFATHGADAIAKVRVRDPIAYLKIVGSLVNGGEKPGQRGGVKAGQ